MEIKITNRKRYNKGATDTQQVYELASALLQVLEMQVLIPPLLSYHNNDNYTRVKTHAWATLEKHDLLSK